MGWLDNIEKAQDGNTVKKDNISSKPIYLKTLDVDRLNYERKYGVKPMATPSTPTLIEDTRTETQRAQAQQRAEDYNNASATWQMPLGYLANPEMLLGDIGVPGFNTSEEYVERIKRSKAGVGGESLMDIAKTETPKAALNTGIALAFSPNLNPGTVANELFNPLAGMDEVVKNATKSFGKDMMQQAPSGAYRVPELTPISTEPTLQLKSTMANNPKGLHTQVNKKGMINTQNALNFIKNNEGQAKYDLVRQGFGETLPKNMKYDDFKKTVSDQLIPLQREARQVKSAPYGIQHIGYDKNTFSELKHLPEVESHIKKLEAYKNNLPAYRKYAGWADDVSDSYIIETDLDPQIASRIKHIEDVKNMSPISENKSIVLKNPEKLGAGDAEHIIDDESTLGHINYVLDRDYPNTMRITQLQSDWAQGTKKFPSKESAKSSVEKSKALAKRQSELAKTAVQQPNGSWLIPGEDLPMSDNVYQNMIKGDVSETVKLLEKEIPNFDQKQLLQKNMGERMLQETIAEAASRKIGKIQIPTRKTAAKIQDYRISSGTEDGFSEEISNLNQTLTNLEGAKLSASPSDIPLIDKEIKRIKGELAGFKPKYEPKHETILKKYDQNVKYLEKLGINPNVITDKKGHTWYEFNTPDTFLKGKGEIKAFEHGGVIKDNRGQWAHPGKVTQIDSNQITMKGVNYPVLGISDTGDRQLMQPGQEYSFDGNNVTEFPIKAQDGSTIELEEVEVVGKRKSTTPEYKAYLEKVKKYKDSLKAYDTQNTLNAQYLSQFKEVPKPEGNTDFNLFKYLKQTTETLSDSDKRNKLASQAKETAIQMYDDAKNNEIADKRIVTPYDLENKYGDNERYENWRHNRNILHAGKPTKNSEANIWTPADAIFNDDTYDAPQQYHTSKKGNIETVIPYKQVEDRGGLVGKIFNKKSGIIENQGYPMQRYVDENIQPIGTHPLYQSVAYRSAPETKDDSSIGYDANYMMEVNLPYYKKPMEVPPFEGQKYAGNYPPRKAVTPLKGEMKGATNLTPTWLDTSLREKVEFTETPEYYELIEEYPRHFGGSSTTHPWIKAEDAVKRMDELKGLEDLGKVNIKVKPKKKNASNGWLDEM